VGEVNVSYSDDQVVLKQEFIRANVCQGPVVANDSSVSFNPDGHIVLSEYLVVRKVCCSHSHRKGIFLLASLNDFDLEVGDGVWGLVPRFKPIVELASQGMVLTCYLGFKLENIIH